MACLLALWACLCDAPQLSLQPCMFRLSSMGHTAAGVFCAAIHAMFELLTSLRCCSEGNLVPGKAPGAVVFVLETLPHARFSRSGATLVHRPRVPLSQALCGGPLHVELLDGTSVSVPLDTIIIPGHKVTVAGKGLPDPAAGIGARGDLVLECDVLFPKELTETQKMLVSAALFLPERKERCDAVKAFQHAYEDARTGWKGGVLK